MKSLRTPNTGCPWDLEQDFLSIAPYTVEEAYEVVDAIERDDMDDLKGELGDLMFQVVFHSQMASEIGAFDFNDVTEAISAKMIERHPHVFGDASMRDSDEQTIAWENQKARERDRKNASAAPVSALDGVARTLPSTVRAQKLQKRAARVGFDWPDERQILEKLNEETQELEQAIESHDELNIDEELGDMMFVMVNLCRKLGVDAEQSLKKANQKFETRFKAMEALARESGPEFHELKLDDQEALWQAVKLEERTKKALK